MADRLSDEELTQAYNRLGEEYQKINSAEKFSEFIVSLGKFSQNLDSENAGHKQCYNQILSHMYQRFANVPKLPEIIQTGFAKLPHDQKMQYIKLTGNSYHALTYQDYQQTLLSDTLKQKTAETAHMSADELASHHSLDDRQFVSVLQQLSGRGTASIASFAKSADSRGITGDMLDGHGWVSDTNDWLGLSLPLQKTKDIIATKMHTDGLEEVLATKDHKKIHDYYIFKGRRYNSGFYDGEGLDTFKKKSELAGKYLQETKATEEFKQAESTAEKAMQMGTAAIQAENATNEIHAAGVLLTNIRRSFSDGISSIHPAELEEALSNVLQKKHKPFSLQTAASPAEAEKITKLNMHLEQLSIYGQVHHVLASYSGELLQDKTLTDLGSRYKEASEDFRSKDTAAKTFREKHQPELTFYYQVKEIDDHKQWLDRQISQEETKRKEAGRRMAPDLDKKAEQLKDLTPQQRYQQRVKAYYQAKATQKR